MSCVPSYSLTRLAWIVSIQSQVAISSKSPLVLSDVRGAQGFVIVVDLSRKDTLTNVQKYIDQIYSRTDIKNPTVMVLANKKDLDRREITTTQIEEF